MSIFRFFLLFGVHVTPVEMTASRRKGGFHGVRMEDPPILEHDDQSAGTSSSPRSSVSESDIHAPIRPDSGWGSMFHVTIDRLSRANALIDRMSDDPRLFARHIGGGAMSPIRILATTESSSVVESSVCQGGCWAKRMKVAGESLPKVVVKYTNDCSDRLHGSMEPVHHPILKEGRILFALNGSGLIVTPMYVSAPSLLVPMAGRDPWIMSLSLYRDYQTCLEAGTTVRYLVQERAGLSVGKYLKAINEGDEFGGSAAYFTSVLRVTIKLMRMLQQLHSLGILHGDIHEDNVVLSHPVADALTANREDLLLIDFEFAEFFPASNGSDIYMSQRALLNVDFLSPWHLMNQRLGPRDDVYRTVEMAARLLSQGMLREGIDRVAERALAQIGLTEASATHAQMQSIRRSVSTWYKTREPLFKHSAELNSECCQEMGLQDDIIAPIQERLEHIALHVRAYNHPDMVPEYEIIIRHLEEVLAMVS